MLELEKRWLLAFLEGEGVPLSPAPPQWALTLEASLFGMGVILSEVDFSTGQIKPTVALEMKISISMATALGIQFREATSKVFWEARAILVGLRFWCAKVRGAADSTVAYVQTRRLEVDTPALKWVGAELNLQSEVWQVAEIIPHHLPGRLKKGADWLSRPDSRGAMPDDLVGLTLGRWRRCCPPPGQDSSLWGQTARVSRAFVNL
jgi:hypothetical protein